MDGKDMVEYIELHKTLRENSESFRKYNFLRR